MPPGRVVEHMGSIAAIEYSLNALQDQSFLVCLGVNNIDTVSANPSHPGRP